MENTNLVASELNDSGFRIRVSNKAIEVSLDNRKVNTMEIWYELDQKFEGIEFSLERTSEGVLVTV